MTQLKVCHNDQDYPVSFDKQSRSGVFLKKKIKAEGLDQDKVAKTFKGLCSKAFTQFLKELPDLVVAGVNLGDNSGRAFWYSGTVACAIEGALKGIPSISFSVIEKETLPHTPKFIQIITETVLKNPLQPGILYNVNFPRGTKIKGLKIARQSRGLMVENIFLRESPQDNPYFWIGGKYKDHEEPEHSEKVYLDQGYATLTPLRVCDITHEKELSRLSTLSWK